MWKIRHKEKLFIAVILDSLICCCCSCFVLVFALFVFFYHCCPVFLFSMRWYFCFPWDERDNLTCHCDLKSEIGLRISD